MELSLSISCLSLSPLPRPSQPYVSVSFSQSSLLSNSSTSLLLRKAKTCTRGSRVVAQPRSDPPRKGLTCNALFGLGVPELVVIAGVAALVFGPKKLPEVGKSIGKTVKSFQQAAKEFETELKKEPDAVTDPPAEKPTAVGAGDKRDAPVRSSKENV